MGKENSGTPKADLLQLDGKQIVGEHITKTEFFNFLEMDLADYSDVQLTPAQALKFRNHVVRMKYGTSAAIPILCPGKRCLNKLCVFHESDKYPLTKPCLLETRMIQTLTASYMEDLGVDPESITEMVLVNKLVEADIMDYRINIGLSGSYDEEAVTLLKTNIMQNGDMTSETTNLHPLLEAKEKWHRMRQNILESLAATRREKYKRAAALKETDDSDTSSHFANMRDLFSAVASSKADSLEKIKEDAKDVAFDTSLLDTDWTSDE